MAVTNQTGKAPRPLIAAPDRSASSDDEKLMRRRSTDSGESDSDQECGSPRHSDGSKKSFPVKCSRRASAFERAPSKCENEVEHERNARTKVYFDKRLMSPLQERFNAVTMVPGMVYSVYFCWMVSGYRQGIRPWQRGVNVSEWDYAAQEEVYYHECANLPFWMSLPPLPVLAGGAGCLLHSSFSFLYHWKYATTIEPSKRITHWSRRLDSASIHLASVGACYATSGRVGYSLLSAAFHLESALLHAEEKVRPRRNLARIGVSILLYVLPVLVRSYGIFLRFLAMFAVCGWLFVRYPFGGWSHSLFHVVLTALPHLVMSAAMQLESSQHQIALAAKCASMSPEGLL